MKCCIRRFNQSAVIVPIEEIKSINPHDSCVGMLKVTLTDNKELLAYSTFFEN